MSSSQGWILDALNGVYTADTIGDYVNELADRFDRFMSRLTDDERNYLLEAASAMKDKLITSKIEGVISLQNPDDISSGDEFLLEGDKLKIISDNFEDPTSQHNLGSIETLMSSDFYKKRDIVSAPVNKNSFGESNTVSVTDLSIMQDAVSKNATAIVSTKASVNSVEASNPNSIVNVGFFKNRYILSRFIASTDSISLSIPVAYQVANLKSCSIGYVEQDITDGELKGSGSKLTDFVVDTPASQGSNYVDNIHVVLNYENTYTINIDGTDYSYTAQEIDTAEDIASGLESELSNNAELTVSTDIGYWSKVFKNDNGDKVFGWYALVEDDSRTFAVKFVVPSDTHDLTIEVDPNNPDGIIITYEHDGFDPVYPTVGDIVDLVNNFGESEIRVVIMPGHTSDEEYNTADNFSLDIGASKIIIEASKQLSVGVDTTSEPYKFTYTHVSDYQAPATFSGHFEVVKFNPADTYYVVIDGTQITIDPSQPEYSSVTDEASLASAFVASINSASLGVTASSTATVVAITADSGGVSHTITTSGENNYQVPIERSTILRYDLRNMPRLGEPIEVPLRKGGEQITSKLEPLSNSDINNIVNSGFVFNRLALMLPSAPAVFDKDNNFVPAIKDVAGSANQYANSMHESIAAGDTRVKPVIRSFARISSRLNTTGEALSNRWFFVEAGSNSLAPSTSIGIGLETISPEDYERLVLQDANKSFSSARENRLGIQEGTFESLTSLVTEDVPSYNAGGFYAEIPVSKAIISTGQLDIIKEELSDMQIDGFVKFALIPKIVYSDAPDKTKEDVIETTRPDELYRALMELSLQMNDALREERFISLAGAYIIDSSELPDYFGDEDYRGLVFGVYEDEVPPENNYGLGGIPIDQTVTMSSLYFRNMRNLSMPIANKSASSAISVGPEDAYMLSCPSGIVSIDVLPSGESIYDIRCSNGRIEKPRDTRLDDFIYRELARTGFFTSKIDVALNHSVYGYSSAFSDSVWSVLMNGVEIRDDETVVGINSARTIIQNYYNTFEGGISIDELAVLMSPSKRVFGGTVIAKTNTTGSDETNVITDVKNVSQYGAITTLFLKVLLFFREKKDTIAYTDWEGKFNGIVGRIFQDDELATDILSFGLFNVFVCEVGAHSAFSYSTDIYNTAKSYMDGLDMSVIASAASKNVDYTAEWKMDATSGRCGVVLTKTV